MSFLHVKKASNQDFKMIYKVVTDASIAGLAEVRPIVQNTLEQIVGTQYYSLLALKKMGHPYKSHPPGGLKPGIINYQTGDFYKSFRITGPQRAGYRLTLWVENDNVLGELLESGTARMIKRPWQNLLMWNLQRSITPVLGALISKNIKLRWKN